MTARSRLLVLAALALVASHAPAQGRRPAPGPASGGVPEPLRGVAFEPPAGGVLPGDVALTDTAGATRPLAALLAGRPAVIVPVYYECPMLCSLVLDGLERALRALRLDPGEQFDVLVFSIDPTETTARAATARRTFLERYGRPDTAHGVRFLTAERPAIDRLTGALGFRSQYDENTGEYAHAAGVVVTTPDLRIARFLSGVDYPARDLRLALVEAGRGEVGTALDRVLLYCFRYDASTGRYSATVMGLVRLGGVLTVAALASFVLWSCRADRRRARREAR